MRLIDADALKKKKKHSHKEFFENVVSVYDIDNAPTIEAEPIKHGRWINVKISLSGDSSAECSLCGAVVHNNFSNVINHCPNCGARSDLTE